nr:hypothetical protein [uncultured Adlercreutzia sp.]
MTIMVVPPLSRSGHDAESEVDVSTEPGQNQIALGESNWRIQKATSADE